MLWSMLNLICFLIPIMAALAAAKDVGTGLVGYALAIAIGLALGGCSTWAMWTVGERVGAAAQTYPESKRERAFRALYVGAVMWSIAVGFLSVWLISGMMRLVA